MTKAKSKIVLPKAEAETEKAPQQIDLKTLLENVGKRLYSAEVRLEALQIFLLEENVISRSHLQGIVNLVEDHRVIQRTEKLSNEETYKRRSTAYKKQFKKK
jgi:hypothetical protein